VVHKRARVHVCDEDNIGRVKWDGGLSSRQPGSRSERHGGVEGLAAAGLASTSVSHTSSGSATKPGSIRCGWMSIMEGTWRQQEACVKA